MAEAGRTVRLSGLPADIDDDRLKDKLSIHFLRSRNGGGEIDSVVTLGAKANSALITFEDSRVAQSVIQRGRHLLEVDGVKYELSASEHRETLQPDKVILRLSATVDYSLLPAGKKALLSLSQNHPDVHTSFDSAATLCKLYGAYSKVQSALAFLLRDPAEPLGHRDSARRGTSGAGSARKPLSQDQSRKHAERQERRQKAPDGEGGSPRREDPLRGGYNGELTSQTECDSPRPAAHSPTPDDEVPLIVDADLFQYLRRCCRDEYDHILSAFGVDAVEMTNEGLTTLFLQASTAAGAAPREGYREQERINLARAAISRLCQDNEGKVCQAQLSKLILSTERGLEKEMQELSLRFPKILLSDDDENIHFVGSHSDVSEAKRLLLLDCVGLRGPHNTLPTSPSSASSSPAPYAEERSPPVQSSPTAQHENDPICQILRLDEDDRRGDGAKKYKLAARFKDSSLLASRPGISPPSNMSRPGPVLVPNTQPEAAWTVDGRVSRGQSSREEPFEKGDMLHSSASMECRLSCNCDLTESPPKSTTADLGIIQPSFSEGTLLQAGRSEPPLRRSSSFTGMPQRKSQDLAPKTQEESTKSAVRSRGRSSSFSSQKGMDRPKVYNAEMPIPYLMWVHIKDAYFGRIEDLMSDVQVKESVSSSSRDLITVIIRGASQSKVTSCQLGLQRLLDSVSADYCQEKIILSELGVTDITDETLQACFTEIRSRLKKITIHPRRKGVYFLGPQKMCIQVSNSVREVFSKNCRQMLEQDDFKSPVTFNWKQPADWQSNEDQSLHSSSNSLAMLEAQAGKLYDSGSEVREETPPGTEPINASLTKPKRDLVAKQNVKREVEGQRILVEPLEIPDDGRHVNGTGSTSTHTDEGIAIPRLDCLPNLYDLDPSQLVSQVQASMQNLFSNGPKMPEMRESSSLWTSNWTPSTALERNQSHSVFGNSNAHTMQEGQVGKDYGPDVKPKVRGEGTLGPDGQKPPVNTSASGTAERGTRDFGLASPDNDVGLDRSERRQRSSPKETTQQRKEELPDAPKRQTKSTQGGICVCGRSGTPMKQTKCGATMCLRCLDDVHIHCRACHAPEPASQCVTGKMSLSNLSISVPGYQKDPAIKITYYISDGTQGENHPSPGQPFSGGVFQAYLPDCDRARRLLPRLKEAFKRGLTFTILHHDTGDKAAWDCIPHKTSINGGKSGQGYPDSTYLKRLSEVLSSHGI